MVSKRKVILITGAAGFIGSHLSERFLRNGDRVIGVDNFCTGSRSNLKLLEKHPRFDFMKRDVSEPFRVPGGLYAVMHFASPASPPDYLKHPIDTLKVGSLGTLNTLRLAAEKKARFMIASTSEIYGDPLESPQTESYWGNVNSIGVRSCYDEAKRFSEALTMGYHRAHRVDTKIIRIFNTYGPRMRPEDGRVIPNFISQAITGKPLTVYGKGTQTRSYCYVDDLVSGIEKVLASSLNVPVNLGNPNEMTVSKLAVVIKRLTGSKSRIVYKELPSDDPKRRCPDIRRAKTELGWAPVVGLEEGLTKTISYFRSLL